MTLGLATSAFEYIVAIVVFLVLFFIVLILPGTKTYKEKGLYWGTYHNFFILMFLFIIARLFLLAYLMYLRLGFFATLDATPPSSNNYASLVNTGNILVILWEFINLIGLDLLFSLVSYGVLIWKRMTERVTSADYPIFFLFNGLLYFFTFITLVVQFVVNTASIYWINIAFIIWSCYAIFGSFFLFYSVNRVPILIREETNSVLTSLKRKLNNVQFLGWLTGLSLIFRAFALIIDILVYPYIPTGTIGQTIWNLIFKYVFWIIPEFIILVFIGWAYIDTDEFITQLAVISIEYEQGKLSRMENFNLNSKTNTTTTTTFNHPTITTTISCPNK